MHLSMLHKIQDAKGMFNRFLSHFLFCSPFLIFLSFNFVFIDHVYFFINLLLVLLVHCHCESLLDFFRSHPLLNFHLKYLTFFLLQLLTFAHCFIEIFFNFSLLLIGDEFTQAHLVCVLRNRQYCIHCKIISNNH